MNLFQDIVKKLLYPALIAIVIAWCYYTTVLFDINAGAFGIHPRDPAYLTGIFTVPLVHANLQHLTHNLLSLTALAALLYIVYSPMASRVLALCWLLTGVFMFVFARGQFVHVGASGVVYALIAFLVVAGLISQRRGPMVIMLVVILFYGSAVWGLFPLQAQVSWDGHLSGVGAGAIIALGYKKRIQQLFPHPVQPEWFEAAEEDEEEDEYKRFEQDKYPEERD
jgi:membrane associated rhomboid family serine protease